MRKKWIFITAICVVFVLLTAVFSVLMFQLRHKHELGEARVYHVYNNRIYYTRQCVNDSNTQSFETEASFLEVIESVGADDKIVIEEDISSSQIFQIKSFVSQSNQFEKEVVVNIDLNNKKICSMFELLATYGTIKFNICNGIIQSNYKNVFKLSGENGKIELNIKDVDCYSVGDKNAPLYVEGVNDVSVNALNSKFISKNDFSTYSNYGVGVFLNNDGDFKFENCLLEGGDGLHVKSGDVSLIKCNLVNTGLPVQDYQSVKTGFSAVGASLAAHCYTSIAGTTNFNITIESCVMTTNNSNRVMYVYKVAETGYNAQVNDDSFVNIKSCKFDEDPNCFDNLGRVIYLNGSSPINNGNGYWVYGNVG